MESQPQNLEFRNDPENFHPCTEPLKHMLKADVYENNPISTIKFT